MSPALRIEELTVAYRVEGGGRRVVVSDVDLDVPAGTVVGLAGESGCGKSTLALAATGYRTAHVEILSGRSLLGGVDLLTLGPPDLRQVWGRRIAFVAQNASGALNPATTIERQFEQSLRTHSTLRGNRLRTRAAELLDAVGIPEPPIALRRYPHQFSGGQQQRIAIALAIAPDPAVVILDEPTTGLDVTTQARITAMLKGLLANNGIAALYVSHDLALLGTIADQIVVMYGGRIVERAPCSDLLTAPRHPYTRALLRAAPDIDARRRLIGIPGRPPLAVEEDRCGFAARCPAVVDACTAGPIEIRRVDTDHLVRCVRVDEVAQESPPRPAPHTTTTGSTQVLAVDGLTCAYRAGQPPIVRDVSFSTRAGEILGIVGESGSGKSTLLRALAGMLAPSAGTIRLDGEPLAGLAQRRRREHRRSIQLVFQDPLSSLNPAHTAAEILRRPVRLFRPEVTRDAERAEIDRLLESVNLAPEVAGRRPGELSGGQLQRLSIARALAARPRVILCDEVTSSLDLSVQAVIVSLLHDLVARTALSLVFVSHDLGVVRAMCDHTLVMRDGRIREGAETQRLFTAPADPYTIELLTAQPRLPTRSTGQQPMDQREVQTP